MKCTTCHLEDEYCTCSDDYATKLQERIATALERIALALENNSSLVTYNKTSGGWLGVNLTTPATPCTQHYSADTSNMCVNCGENVTL